MPGPAGCPDAAAAVAAPLRLLLALLLAPGCRAVDTAISVSPIEKVLELLHGMAERAREEKHLEVLQWTSYQQWCSEAELQKQTAVQNADLQIESLKAGVEMFGIEVERLGEEIKGHESDVLDFEASLKNGTADRTREREQYEVMRQDYSDSIHATSEAIKVLKEQAYDRVQVATMLQQVSSSHGGFAQAARPAIEALLAEASSGQADVAFILAKSAAFGSAAPGEAHGYEFQSGSVIALLEELLDKFRGELTALEKDEMKKNHAYEVLAQDLRQQKDAAEHEMGKKARGRAVDEQASADAASALAGASATRADDTKFLEDLRSTCSQKSHDFEARQELRQEEVEAFEKAMEILSGQGVIVAAAAKERLASSAVGSRGSSLLQLRSSPPQAAEARARAEAFLQEAGARIGSHTLSMLAARLRDSADPYGKVRKMIQELLSRLSEEANDEADHKQWCDTELSTNEQARTAKAQEVEALHTTIERLESRISILRRSVADLSKAVAAIEAQMAAASKLRTGEQARNQDSIASSAGAQLVVAEAMRILKDYYAKAGASAALVQQRQRQHQLRGSGSTWGSSSASQAPAPPIFQGPFQGRQTESYNIIAFLEVIQSDFARLESQVTTAEQAAQVAYDDLVADADADKRGKEEDNAALSSELSAKEQDSATASNDLDLAQSELDSAAAYYDKLKPSCVGASSTSGYEERLRRREEEISALTEALDILSGKTLVSAPQALYSSVEGGNVGYEVGITASPDGA